MRAALRGGAAPLAQGPGFVLYAIMDFVVDQYFPIVDALEDELEKLEDEIFDAQPRSRDDPERIYRLKRDMLAVKRAIAPLIDVCNRLVRFDRTLIRRGDAALLPRRLRSRRSHQRDRRQPARALDQRAREQPVADRPCGRTRT